MSNQNARGVAVAAITLAILGAIGIASQNFGFSLMLGVPFVAGMDGSISGVGHRRR